MMPLFVLLGAILVGRSIGYGWTLLPIAAWPPQDYRGSHPFPLVDEAPSGSDWLHKIKYDGYRMHARIDGGQARLLTRTGLDWSLATAA
jgi:hypothetical protein